MNQQKDTGLEQSAEETDAGMDGQHVHGPIRGSKRYISYSALTQEVGIWDLCKAECVRCCASGGLVRSSQFHCSFLHDWPLKR